MQGAGELMPKISVVTVCYNAVETIEKTILSVINQTYQNIEYIIIDGASKDGTVDIIKKHQKFITKWVSKPDNGIYDAMNKSLRFVTGDWIFFLNSGDLFSSNETLKRVSERINNTNTIYYGDVMQLPAYEKYGGKFNKWRLSKTNICHQSIFYPYDVFKKYSYDTHYKIYADWVLNISCMGDANLKFEYINILVSFYDTQGFSQSRNDETFWKRRFEILRAHLGYKYMIYAKTLSFIHNLIFPSH